MIEANTLAYHPKEKITTRKKNVLSNRRQVTETGARITVPRSSVALTIPHGAIRPGSTSDLFVAVLQPEFYRPLLDDSQTAMTPVIRCGVLNCKPDYVGTSELLKPGGDAV
jgi:hypothetical protein